MSALVPSRIVAGTKTALPVIYFGSGSLGTNWERQKINPRTHYGAEATVTSLSEELYGMYHKTVHPTQQQKGAPMHQLLPPSVRQSRLFSLPLVFL